MESLSKLPLRSLKLFLMKTSLKNNLKIVLCNLKLLPNLKTLYLNISDNNLKENP